MQEPTFTTLLPISDHEEELMSFHELRPALKESDYDQHYEPAYNYDSALLDGACSSSLYRDEMADTPKSEDLQEVDTTVNFGNRKRKVSIKQNHSEIEKRRRDKMNTYITELSSMIPLCTGMSRKLDKITVLKMAVDFLKTIRGPAHSYTETHYKPPLISDQELKQIILQVAEGFIIVVGCDRGKIHYVSESVSGILNFSQNDLLRQSLFDLLHPKDVAKVKEQLASSQQNPRERFISNRISRLCPGARRSFFCRMKYNPIAQMKEKFDMNDDILNQKESQNIEKKYVVIHCTGYLKSWASPKMSREDFQENDVDSDCFNVSCLISVCRTLSNISSTVLFPQEMINIVPLQFISKYTLDGKFLYVDQRATLVLGFLPQELLGCSMYEYFHPDDIPSLSDDHKKVLESSEKLFTKTYRFKTKEGSYIFVQSEWKIFKNPWTKETEYLISKNNLMSENMTQREEISSSRKERTDNFEYIDRTELPESSDQGIVKMIEEEASNTKQPSEGNDEAAMAIIMSLLEVDAGLGGPVDFSGLPWPLP